MQKEKSRLESEIKNLSAYPDYGDTSDDNDLELRDFENNKSIEDRLSMLLKKVDSALLAIQNGTYGQCKKCRQAIEQGRLKNMPYADICVTCSTKNGQV